MIFSPNLIATSSLSVPKLCPVIVIIWPPLTDPEVWDKEV